MVVLGKLFNITKTTHTIIIIRCEYFCMLTDVLLANVALDFICRVIDILIYLDKYIENILILVTLLLHGGDFLMDLLSSLCVADEKFPILTLQYI